MTTFGSLRSRLHEETGLPASQGLRLKCGSRDLRDRDPVSAIDADGAGDPEVAGSRAVRQPAMPQAMTRRQA